MINPTFLSHVLRDLFNRLISIFCLRMVSEELEFVVFFYFFLFTVFADEECHVSCTDATHFHGAGDPFDGVYVVNAVGQSERLRRRRDLILRVRQPIGTLHVADVLEQLGQLHRGKGFRRQHSPHVRAGRLVYCPDVGDRVEIVLRFVGGHDRHDRRAVDHGMKNRFPQLAHDHRAYGLVVYAELSRLLRHVLELDRHALVFGVRRGEHYVIVFMALSGFARHRTLTVVVSYFGN